MQRVKDTHHISTTQKYIDVNSPIELFKVWMDEAKKSEPNDPNAPD